ncbi:MAG: glucosaminidase domain-containing protein [Verrucomicrobiota bacterium]
MDKSYNITGALSLGGFKEKLEGPQKHWSVFDLRRILFLANVGWFFGVCLLVGVIYWSVGYAYQKELARKASLEEVQGLEAKIAELNSNIQGLKDLNLRTVASTIDYSSNIQAVLETTHGEERAFLLSIIPEALRIQVTHHIPASATIAMAAYESNYGRSDLARQHHNFFGIKALDSRWEGEKALMPTRDRGIQTKASFRVYEGLPDSVQGYAEFLSGSAYYRAAFTQSSGEQFVAQVLKGGYCPDSFYLGYIHTIMQRHQLQRLDFLKQASSPQGEAVTENSGMARKDAIQVGMVP